MKTKSMKVINNELFLGPHKLSDIAKQYQTPLYVYDEKQIIHNIKTYKDAFNSDKINCQVVYASKAFMAPRLIKIIERLDLFIDSVSLGDLYILQRSDFPYSRVLFHGNNKSLYELEAAVELEVGLIVIDSILELNQVIEIANKKQQVVNTLFRLNPHIQTSTHQYIQTSHEDSKFGESMYDEQKIAEIARLYLNNQYVKLRGFHTHIGSQIKSIEPYINLINAMVSFIQEFENKYLFKLDILNVGGGFGIKYESDDDSFPLVKGLRRVIDIVTDAIDEKKISIQQLMIEPGRSIIGNAGFTLYEVSQLKTTLSGKNFLVIDGGMTDNIRPALYQAKYSHDLVDKMTDSKIIDCDIVGKCCESGDIVATETKIANAKPGDILIVYNTGAYGYSMSSNYNNILKPAVIFINDDKINEVIRRETLQDLVKTYNF